MSLPECARCGRPDPTRGTICRDCARPVRQALLQLADLAAETEVNIARLASYGPRSGPRSSTPPIPVDLDAAATAWAAAHIVVTWMDHIAVVRRLQLPTHDRGRPIGPLCADGGWTNPDGRTRCPHQSCEAIRPHPRSHPVAAAARWLAGQIEWLRRSEDAEEAFAELVDAVDEVRRLVENPADRWYAGPCRAPLAGGPDGKCPTHLYAWPGATSVRCPDCGTRHETAARMAQLLDEARDELGTATQLATAAVRLGKQVTAGQIRAYAQRGRLVPALVLLEEGVQGPLEVARDEWGRPHYRLGDVLVLLDQVAADRARAIEERAARVQRRAERAAQRSGSSDEQAPTVS